MANPPSTSGGSGDMAIWSTGPAKPSFFKRLGKYRWLVIAGAMVFGLLLIVAMAPTLASTGWGQSLILNRVNKSINGTVKVNDWSLGWTSGAVIDGLRIFDQEGAQILEARRVSTELTVWDLLFGDAYPLGKARVDAADFLFEKYADGSNNFQKLVKGPPSTKPLRMPDLSGDIVMDVRGTLVQHAADGSSRMVMLDPSTIRLQVPDINASIRHTVSLAVRPASGAAGTLDIDGSIKLFTKNEFNPSAFNADETVEIKSIDLAGIAPLLNPSGPITTLKGMTSGKLVVKLAGDEDRSIEGQLQVNDFAFGGPMLSGDTYTSNTLSLTIPATTFRETGGRIRIGDGTAARQLVLQVEEGSLRVSMDAGRAALEHLAMNEAPGEDGQIDATHAVDVAMLAGKLPHLLHLQEGMKLTSGHLRQETHIVLTVEKAVVKQQIDLPDLAGIDARGRAVSAKPILITLGITSLGGGGAMPNLRDVAIGWTSGFAHLEATGPSLDQLGINGSIRLADVQAELGQFVDYFRGIEMAGTVVLHLATDGNLARPGGTATVDGTMSVEGLHLARAPDAGSAANGAAQAGAAAQRIDQPWVQIGLRAQISRGADPQFLKAVKDAVLTLQSGDKQKPTIDAVIRGDLAWTQPSAGAAEAASFSVPHFDVTKLDVDLPTAQEQFAPLIDGLRQSGLVVSQGSVSIQGAGSYGVNGTVINSFLLTTRGLTLGRRAGDRLTPIVKAYDARLELAGAVRQDTEGVNLRLAKLSYGDGAAKILSLTKLGDGDLAVSLPVAGTRIATGKVQVAADVRAISDVVRALASRTVALGGGAGELESGNLAGTIELLRPEAGQTLLVGDLAMDNLSLSTHAKPIRNQRVTLSIRASARDDLSSVIASQVDLRSSFMNVLIGDTVVRLPGENAQGQQVDWPSLIEKCRLTLDIPDVPAAMALATALAPTGAGSPTTRPNPEQPVELKSGSLAARLAFTHGENGLAIQVEQLSGKQVAFTRGQGSFGPVDVKLNLGGVVNTNNQDLSIPMLARIREVRIDQLSGSLGVVSVEMRQPIVFSNPAGEMTASGAVAVDGKIRPALDLLEALQIVPHMEYSGSFKIEQQLATEGKVVTATGQIELTDFKVGNVTRPVLAEDRLHVANDITLDRGQERIDLRKLSLEMQSSKALSIDVAGGIKNYLKQPATDNLRLTLGYDAEKLLKIIRPMIDAQLTPEQREQIRDLELSGMVENRAFVIRYPVGKKGAAAPESFDPRRLAVTGELAFDRVKYAGLTVEQLPLPIDFSGGVLTFAYAGKEGDERYAPPAKLNGGGLDLSGLQVTLPLAGKRMTVSSLRADHKLLDDVAVNKEFLERFMASVSPLFAGSEEARGKISVTINKLTNFPLDQTVLRAKSNYEPARFTFSITDFAIKNPFLSALASQLRNLKVEIEVNRDGTVPGTIRDGTFALDDGVVHSEVPLDLGGQVIRMEKGQIRLEDEKILSLTMQIPTTMIPQVRLPMETLAVPVEGTLRKPKFDILKAVAANAGNILKNLIPLPKAGEGLPVSPGGVGRP